MTLYVLLGFSLEAVHKRIHTNTHIRYSPQGWKLWVIKRRRRGTVGWHHLFHAFSRGFWRRLLLVHSNTGDGIREMPHGIATLKNARLVRQSSASVPLKTNNVHVKSPLATV